MEGDHVIHRLERIVRFSVQWDDWNEVQNRFTERYQTDRADITFPGIPEFTFDTLSRPLIRQRCREAEYLRHFPINTPCS